VATSTSSRQTVKVDRSLIADQPSSD
jgi:hypothetical protein